jgi:hypothetical protein
MLIEEFLPYAQGEAGAGHELSLIVIVDDAFAAPANRPRELLY